MDFDNAKWKIDKDVLSFAVSQEKWVCMFRLKKSKNINNIKKLKDYVIWFVQ